MAATLPFKGQTASAPPICFWVKNITETICQIFELTLGIFQVWKTLASKEKLYYR